tara:strand:+ start:4030 stop:4275 length:246 start_codon:yes stop_codon:yes gene_type:complete
MTDQERIAKLRDGSWDQTVVRGPNPTGFCVDETLFAQETADRINELDAKLAKAVEALQWIAFRPCSWRSLARATLAELEGL